MTFFEVQPQPQTSRPDPQRQPWRGSPDDTLGVPVPFAEVLARSEDVAVIVRDVVGFPLGFSFSLIILSRLDPPPPHDFRSVINAGIGETAEGGFRFGIGLADGSRIVPQRPGLPSGSTSGSLQPRGGTGRGRILHQSYFCELLPPPGELRFVCEWPAYGIAESVVTMDAQFIVGAAEKAKPVWPDDVGLPEPPDAPGPPASSIGPT